MTALRFTNLFLFHVEMKPEMFYRLRVLLGWMCLFNSWVVKGQGRHVEDPSAASCSTWFRTWIFHSTSGIWTCFSHIFTQHHSQPALDSFFCIVSLLLWNWIVQCKCFEKMWGSFLYKILGSSVFTECRINEVLMIIANWENAENGKGILSS